MRSQYGSPANKIRNQDMIVGTIFIFQILSTCTKWDKLTSPWILLLSDINSFVCLIMLLVTSKIIRIST